MLQLDPNAQLPAKPSTELPSSIELPCSDDIPVDLIVGSLLQSENQNLLPNYLLFLLQRICADRQDWFFAVDMGLYRTLIQNHCDTSV